MQTFLFFPSLSAYIFSCQTLNLCCSNISMMRESMSLANYLALQRQLMFFLILLRIELQLYLDLRHMSKPRQIQAKALIGYKAASSQKTFNDNGSILYSLGIGFNLDPLRSEDFKYTNEMDAQFVTFPTIASTFGMKENFQLLQNSHMPEFEIHQILHAQEKLYMNHTKVKPDTKYRLQMEVIDVLDKGKNAFIVGRIRGMVTNAEGKEEEAYHIDRTTFIRGLGGFGYKGCGAYTIIPDLPKREPDAILTEKTFPNQAFFYRLNGDPNPLHIDPNFSALANFERPIIHGLASYGIVAKSIIQNLLGNDSQKMKSYEVRMIGHVFPGESFAIKVWKEGNKIFFLAEVVERKTKCLSGVLTVRENAKL